MKNSKDSVPDNLAEYLTSRKLGQRLWEVAAGVSRDCSPEDKNLEDYFRICARRMLLVRLSTPP